MRIHLKWQAGVETKISNYVQKKKDRQTEKKAKKKEKTQTLRDKEGQVNISKHNITRNSKKTTTIAFNQTMTISSVPSCHQRCHF